MPDINGVEIFKSGKWTDRGGRTIEYTSDDVASIAQSYLELQEENKASLKITHDKQILASGWVKNLYVKVKAGITYLMADFERVPEEVYKSIKEMRLRHRSSELAHKYKANSGKVYKYVLRAVAFLGTDMPAVSGLSDIELQAHYTTFQADDLFEYEMFTGSNIGALHNNPFSSEVSHIMEKENKNQSVDTEAINAKLADLQKQIDDKDAKLLQYKKGEVEQTTLTDELAKKIKAEYQDMFEKQEAENKILFSRLETITEQRHVDKIGTDVEKLITTTHITKAAGDELKLLLHSCSTENADVSCFSKDDKVEKKTQYDALLQFAEKYCSKVPTGEMVKPQEIDYKYSDEEKAAFKEMGFDSDKLDNSPVSIIDTLEEEVK